MQRESTTTVPENQLLYLPCIKQICQNDDNAERDKLKQFNIKHCLVQGNYVGMLCDHERACQCM